MTISDCSRRGYWLVAITCKDRNKLLFDTVCTLADMDYDVYHATVDSHKGTATQEYYIKPRYGSSGGLAGCCAVCFVAWTYELPSSFAWCLHSVNHQHPHNIIVIWLLVDRHTSGAGNVFDCSCCCEASSPMTSAPMSSVFIMQTNAIDTRSFIQPAVLQGSVGITCTASSRV